MANKGKSLSDDVTRILAEFLDVAINNIIFVKEIYHPGAFERRRYMNLVVQKARHPQLQDYIKSVVACLQPFIQKGLVERVVVIFYGLDLVPVEKFVFKLSINQSFNSEVRGAEMEFSFRSFLLKLPLSKPLMRPLPPDCRWEVAGYFRCVPYKISDSKEAETWIPTDTKHWQNPPLITPIKSMTSEPLCLQLYLEQPKEAS